MVMAILVIYIGWIVNLSSSLQLCEDGNNTFSPHPFLQSSSNL